MNPSQQTQLSVDILWDLVSDDPLPVPPKEWKPFCGLSVKQVQGHVRFGQYTGEGRFTIEMYESFHRDSELSYRVTHYEADSNGRVVRDSGRTISHYLELGSAPTEHFHQRDYSDSAPQPLYRVQTIMDLLHYAKMDLFVL